MALRDWSVTATSNASADGDIPLNGSTTSIRKADDSQRAIMQKLAIYLADTNGSRETTGENNAYEYVSAGFEASPSDAFTAYATGDVLVIKPNFTNVYIEDDKTTAATLDVDSVGGKAIRKYRDGSETDIEAGDIVLGQPMQLIYDADANSPDGAWILLNPGFVSPADLSGYATTEALASYATIASVTTTLASYATTESVLTALTGKQAASDLLTAIDGLTTSGLVARTADGAAAVRTITGGTGITITNGNGVDGNPTIAATLATQAEAEAGTLNTKLMTPLRVAQAIAALSGNQVYSGTSTSNVNFPVGTCVVGFQDAGATRNGAVAVYLHSSVISAFTTGGSRSTALSGTWNARGIIQNTSSMMYQRSL